MRAVVEISGIQFDITEGDIVKAPFIDAKNGEEVSLGRILLTKDGDNLNIGTPEVNGSVTAKVIEQIRDPKILVFHKKRRKGYQKMNGHRQPFTKIEIKSININ
jgi:large subunit ribosomal protein L21